MDINYAVNFQNFRLIDQRLMFGAQLITPLDMN